MIAAHEVELNVLYEVVADSEVDYNDDVDVLLYTVGIRNEGGFRTFNFLWLSGDYEGRVVEGARVSFNTMVRLKRIA